MEYIEPYLPPTANPKQISSLPRMGFGFLFVVAFWVADFVDPTSEGQKYFSLYGTPAFILGWIFWLFCVHRLHRILDEITDGSYPNSPGQTVGFHFIPILNLWWFMKWPRDMADHLRAEGHVGMVPGWLLGLVFLLANLSRLFDGGLSLLLLFLLGLYLRAKLAGSLRGAGHLEPRPITESGSRKTGVWARIGIGLGVVAVLLVLIVVALGIGVESGLLPDSAAIPGPRIHPRQVRQLHEMGVIHEHEEVLFFYSGGFLSIRADGNLFTESRVISYFEAEGELQVEYAFYDEIATIDFYPSQDWAEDSVIEVILADDRWFQLIVSPEEGGDERFHQHLVRKWKGAATR